MGLGTVAREEITPAVSRFPSKSHLGWKEGIAMPSLATPASSRAVLVLLIALIGLNSWVRAEGQSPALRATSFDQLSVLVRPGDTVTVTPASGTPFSGKITGLSSSGLTLLVGKELRPLQESDVATIRHRRQDSLSNGALWGLGVGAAAGFSTCGFCHPGPGLMMAGMFGGIGAGIGVGVDALIKGNVVLFQRRDSGRRVTLMPQLAKSHKSVNVSVQF
jgi:hypothetical protein